MRSYFYGGGIKFHNIANDSNIIQSIENQIQTLKNKIATLQTKSNTRSIDMNALDSDSNGVKVIDGNLYINGTITQRSSANVKKNIQSINDDNIINKLNPVTYNIHNKKHYGFIAQEIQKILPELVYTDVENEFVFVNYIELIPLLVHEIKSQRKLIDKLKDDIDTLKVKLHLLKM